MTAKKTKPLWPKIGLLVAVGLVAQSVWINELSVFQITARLQFIALVLHQFEEYVLPGGFTDFYNAHIYRKSPLTRVCLNTLGVYLVNIIWGWGVYGFSIFDPDLMFLLAGLAFVHLINAGAHIGMALVSGRRNPGVVTSIVVLLPCVCWVFYLCAPNMDFVQWLLAVLFIPGAIIAIQTSIWLGSKLSPGNFGD